MKKILFIQIFALLFTVLRAQEWIDYRIQARLVVYDAALAGDRLVSWLESKGGYFLSLQQGRIQARLPVGEVAAAEDALKNLSADILGYNLSASDISGDIRRLEASLSSRREVLDQNLAYLQRSDFSSTLAIEKEVTDLISEIEAVRGQIAALELRSRYATLELDLESQGIQSPGGSFSNFAWINSIDFYSFIEGQPEPRFLAWIPRFGDPEQPPLGFSVFRDSRLYRAISPDGVQIRIRQVKPQPVMDMAFWKTAVAGYMEDSGYVARKEPAELKMSSGQTGWTFSWLAPYSGEEYLFQLIILPEDRSGKKLRLVEISGRLESFDQRSRELNTWIEELLKH